jgi:hypothetical protein
MIILYYVIEYQSSVIESISLDFVMKKSDLVK